MCTGERAEIDGPVRSSDHRARAGFRCGRVGKYLEPAVIRIDRYHIDSVVNVQITYVETLASSSRSWRHGFSDDEAESS
jgi:hypothetical protein